MTTAEDSHALAWMRELGTLGPELADAKLDEILAGMSVRELAALEHDWTFWQRPKQRAPRGIWRVLLVLAGRAFGKTRMFSEYVIDEVMHGRAKRVALISMTDDDAKKVMIEGQHSGLLVRSPPWFQPSYQSSKDGGKLTWPNGSIAYVYSAEAPRKIRGEEFDLAWWDEVANCSREEIAAVWYNLRMALRGSERARALLSTTPQRGVPLLKELVGRALKNPGGAYRVVRGHTFDNAANLPLDYQADLLEYKGTALGRQELEGEILDEDDDDTIFKTRWIRRCAARDVPKLVRVAIAVDPAISVRAGSDKTGIVVVGLGVDGNLYVLADRSGKHSADAWPRIVVELYREWSKRCDDVIAVLERNRGGDLVAAAVHRARADLSMQILEVNSQETKATRADPVAARYERGLVFHVGELAELEDQITTWRPQKDRRSPDRLDALVHAIFELSPDVDPRRSFDVLDRSNDFTEWRAVTGAQAARDFDADAERVASDEDDFFSGGGGRYTIG